MRKFCIILFLFSFFRTGYCQQITFQKNFGDPDNSDWAQMGLTTKDSGYLICGTCANAFGQGSECLLKFDDFGNYQWTEFYRATNGFGIGNQIILEETNSDLLLSGSNYQTSTSQGEAKIEKRSNVGQLLWIRSFGDSLSTYGLQSMVKSVNYYISGGVRYSSTLGIQNLLIIKTDTLGNLVWAKDYFGNMQSLKNMTATSDGGIVLTGALSPDSISFRAMIIKIDSAGNPLWTKQYSYNGYFSEGFYVQETPDKGFIVTGIQNGNQFYLLKTDSLGNEQWAKLYYGNILIGRGLWLDQTNDGGFILTGQIGQFITFSWDYLALIKTDSLGNVQWVTSPSGYLNPKYVKQTYDGGYFIYGMMENGNPPQQDLYIIKTDSLGHTGGCNEFPINISEISITDSVTSVTTLVNNLNLITTIPTITNGNGGVLTTICSSVGIKENQNVNERISITPNPNSGYFSLISLFYPIESLRLFDLSGRVVFSKDKILKNTYQCKLNVPDGIYVAEVFVKGNVYRRKVVVVR